MICGSASVIQLNSGFSNLQKKQDFFFQKQNLFIEKVGRRVYFEDIV